MFEICSIDGNAWKERRDRLRRTERSRPWSADRQGRTRQERQFAIRFASRDSERRLRAGRGGGAFGKERARVRRGTRRHADGKTGRRMAVRGFGARRGRLLRFGFENSEEVGRRRTTFESVPASFVEVGFAARRSRFAATSRQRPSVLLVAEVRLRIRESGFPDRPPPRRTKRQRKTPAATPLAFQPDLLTASATKYALDERRFLHPQLGESCGTGGMVAPIRARLALPENDQLFKSAILERNPACNVQPGVPNRSSVQIPEPRAFSKL